MGKKLIIKGADFSANAYAVETQFVDSIISSKNGTVTHTQYGYYFGANTNSYYPTVLVKFKVKAGHSYRLKSRIPSINNVCQFVLASNDVELDNLDFASSNYIQISGGFYYSELTGSGENGFPIVETEFVSENEGYCYTAINPNDIQNFDWYLIEL